MVTFTDTLIRRGIYASVRKGESPLTPGYDLVGGDMALRPNFSKQILFYKACFALDSALI